MKDQKAVLHKALHREEPVFVITGRDINAVKALEMYLDSATENGADISFIEDMKLILEEIKEYQANNQEYISQPNMKSDETTYKIRDYNKLESKGIVTKDQILKRAISNNAVDKVNYLVDNIISPSQEHLNFLYGMQEKGMIVDSQIEVKLQSNISNEEQGMKI